MLSLKVAMPTFENRVSPRFDCSSAFLVATIDHDTVVEQQLLSALGWTSKQRVQRLIEWKIQCVLCGGIDIASADALRSAGVELHPWLAGSIDDVLRQFRQGQIDTFRLPREAQRRRGKGMPAGASASF